MSRRLISRSRRSRFVCEYSHFQFWKTRMSSNSVESCLQLNRASDRKFLWFLHIWSRSIDVIRSSISSFRIVKQEIRRGPLSRNPMKQELSSLSANPSRSRSDKDSNYPNSGYSQSNVTQFWKHWMFDPRDYWSSMFRHSSTLHWNVRDALYPCETHWSYRSFQRWRLNLECPSLSIQLLFKQSSVICRHLFVKCSRPPWSITWDWRRVTISYIRLLFERTDDGEHRWFHDVIRSKTWLQTHLLIVDWSQRDSWKRRDKFTIISFTETSHQHWQRHRLNIETQQTGCHTDRRYWYETHPSLNERLTNTYFRMSSIQNPKLLWLLSTDWRSFQVCVQTQCVSRIRVWASSDLDENDTWLLLRIFPWHICASIQLYHVHIFPSSRQNFQDFVKFAVQRNSLLSSPLRSSSIFFSSRLPLSHIPQPTLLSSLSAYPHPTWACASTSFLSSPSFRMSFRSFPLDHPRSSCSLFIISPSPVPSPYQLFLSYLSPLRAIAAPQYSQNFCCFSALSFYCLKCLHTDHCFVFCDAVSRANTWIFLDLQLCVDMS